MSIGTNNPFFEEPHALKRWKRGPLAPYIDGFANRLCDSGYAAAVGQDYIRCIGHLSIWLEQQGLGISVLDEHRSESTRLNSSHSDRSRMPSSA